MSSEGRRDELGVIKEAKEGRGDAIVDIFRRDTFWKIDSFAK